MSQEKIGGWGRRILALPPAQLSLGTPLAKVKRHPYTKRFFMYFYGSKEKKSYINSLLSLEISETKFFYYVKGFSHLNFVHQPPFTFRRLKNILIRLVLIRLPNYGSLKYITTISSDLPQSSCHSLGVEGFFGLRFHNHRCFDNWRLFSWLIN